MRLGSVAVVVLAAALSAGGMSLAAAAQHDAVGDTQAAGRFLEERCCFTATLLPDGRVLIVGGIDTTDESLSRLATAEIWDPQLLAFGLAGEMARPRAGHTAVLQPDGQVLVIGGTGPLVRTEDAELWDPMTSSFTPAPPMRHPRRNGATVTAFSDGRALIVGGDRSNRENPGQVLKAEVWEPTVGAFEEAGTLPRRVNLIDVLALNDDGALLVSRPPREWLRWDPDRRRFDPAGRPERPRDWVLLLTSGRVLTTGAQRDRAHDDAEVWVPNRGAFRSAGSFVTPRNTASVTALTDGGALFYGGYDALRKDTTLFRSAEYWDPRSRSFSRAGRTAFGREWHTATLLPDGRVAFIGGVIQRAPDQDATVTDLIELWDPASRSFSRAGRLLEPRSLHTTVVLEDGSLLVLAGGDAKDELVPTAELWRPPPVAD